MNRILINLLVVYLVFSHFTISLRIGVTNQNKLQLNANIKRRSEVSSNTEAASKTAVTMANAHARRLRVLEKSNRIGRHKISSDSTKSGERTRD